MKKNSLLILILTSTLILTFIITKAGRINRYYVLRSMDFEKSFEEIVDKYLIPLNESENYAKDGEGIIEFSRTESSPISNENLAIKNGIGSYSEKNSDIEFLFIYGHDGKKSDKITLYLPSIEANSSIYPKLNLFQILFSDLDLIISYKKSGAFDETVTQPLYDSPLLESDSIIFDDSIKCNTKPILELSENIENPSDKLVLNFLYTFDESCKNNVEYSEYSNEVLFDCIYKNPGQVLKLLSHKGVNKKLILDELSSPVNDKYSTEDIINEISKIKTESRLKDTVIQSIRNPN